MASFTGLDENIERAFGETGRVAVMVGAASAPLSAREVLDAVCRAQPSDLVLVEAGPRLMGDFFAEGPLDELFLTLAPQVASRDETLVRPGFVAGKRFAPEHPVWGTLVGLKRGGDHLFLRYAFATACGPAGRQASPAFACCSPGAASAGIPAFADDGTR